MDTTKEFRLGIGNPPRSLSFKISRNKGDVYLVCRELPDFKHSLHESGIHRFAETKSYAREAVERTTLTATVAGYYVTVARIYFTTESDWATSRLLGGKNYLGLLVPTPDQVAIIALGITPHHPASSSFTNLPQNVAVLEISPSKFITATLQIMNKTVLLNRFISEHAPHYQTKFLWFSQNSPGIRATRDTLMHFRTRLNTHTYWVHHNMYNHENVSPGFLQIRNNLEQAHRLSSMGISIGPEALDFTTLAPR